MLALVLGEVTAVFIGNIWWMILILPIFLIIKIITKKQVSLFVMIFLFFVAGNLITTEELIESEYIHKLEEKEVEIIGVVEQISQGTYGWNIVLTNATINDFKCKKWLVTTEEKPEIFIGNAVKVNGYLGQFETASNFGNFDSRKYYRNLGIYGKVNAGLVNVIDDKCDRLRQLLYEIKQKIAAHLDEICSVKNGTIYKAMLLGDKGEIDTEIKDLYSMAGIAHVLAISGLHISFIGMFVYSILRKRFGFSISASTSILLVVSFGIMSGMGIATVRAIVMFGLKLLGEILGRYYDYITVISLSAILIMLENPFVILNSGFQMSYVAIISITLIWPQVQKLLRVKGYMARVAQSINIGILMNPIVAFNYYQLPTYSFILNLIVIPLMNVVIMAGVMGVATSFIGSWIGQVCIFPGCVVLELYTFLCTWFRKLPFANVIVGKPDIWKIVIYYLLYAVFILVANIIRKHKNLDELNREWDIPKDGRILEHENPLVREQRKTVLKFRLATVATWIVLSFIIYISFNDGMLEVTFLDVGQGDGIFLQTDNGATMFVDGGSTSVDSVGKYRIIPFLKAKAVKDIDYAIVTHTDTDHISGLMELIEQSDNNGIEVENLVLPMTGLQDEIGIELLELARNHKVNVMYISKGNKMQLGQVKVECLHPWADMILEGKNDSLVDKNDSSTVLNVTYRDFSMLLTGDISTMPEKEIWSELYHDYTILKVAHHGSKYSTSEEFLEKINPQYSVISVGENNMYGHPSIEILDRLSNANSTVLRTDYSGGITVKVDIEGNVSILGYKR